MAKQQLDGYAGNSGLVVFNKCELKGTRLIPDFLTDNRSS